MTRKIPIIRTNLHSASKTISNQERGSLKTTGVNAKQMAKVAKEKMEKRQDKIDYYNSVTCNIIDPFFNTLQLTGKNVIIRLHKENYIKEVSNYANGVPLYDAWVSQVDGRMHQSEKPKWMDNPLPYVFSGIVVAMSPAVKIDINKEKEEALYLDPNANYKPLEIGDVVYLEHFMYADKRFYTNKQKRDFLKNPQEYRIQHWEGYVKIHPTMIEGIILEPKKFLNDTSPYAKYKITKEIQ